MSWFLYRNRPGTTAGSSPARSMPRSSTNTSADRVRPHRSFRIPNPVPSVVSYGGVCTDDRATGGEAKLVRCAHGAVHDVLVDIRPASPTFGTKRAFVLDDDEFRHLYVPPGFLHGFQALTPTADVCYRIDRPHDPEADLAVAYDDADLAIGWPLPVTMVSARDAHAGSWQELLTLLR